MTRQTLATGQDRSASPKAACGAPKAQGLMNGPARSIMRSCRLSHTVPRVCWHRSGIQGGAHAYVRFLIAQTYIRSGFSPYQAPSCVFARAKGLQGDGTNLDPRRVSAKPAHGHTSTLDSCIPPASFGAVVSPLNWGSGLQDCTGWDDAGFEIAPQSYQELARHCYDRDAPRASFEVADAFAEPDAQGTIGLIAQPGPGEFD